MTPTPERSEPRNTCIECGGKTDSIGYCSAECYSTMKKRATVPFDDAYGVVSDLFNLFERHRMAYLPEAVTIVDAYASQVAEERVEEEKKRADDNFKSYERIKDLYSKSTSEGFTQGFNAARDKAAGKCLYHIVYSAETTNLLGNLEGEIRAMTPDGEGEVDDARRESEKYLWVC